MVKGRNTDIVSIRVTDDQKAILQKRAIRKGWNISEYMKWVALRPHTKIGITTK